MSQDIGYVYHSLLLSIGKIKERRLSGNTYKDCTGIPRVGWRKDSRYMKIYGEMLEYIINYALHLAHYDAYFHVNDDAKRCRYLGVTNNFIFSGNIHLLKIALTRRTIRSRLCYEYTNKNYVFL